MHRLRSFAGRIGTQVARFARPVASAVASFLRLLRRPLRLAAAFLADLAGLVPALVAGIGVFLIVAGLWNYFQPSVPIAPSQTPAVSFDLPSAQTIAPLTPGPSVSPGASATQVMAAATRITIPALGIDDPVIPQPNNEMYPLCNTAEYLILGKAYGYPGAPQATYIYAHARVRMFWNLLVQSKIRNGAGMIGAWVEVYTDDNQRHIYEITQVFRHVPPNTSFGDKAFAATTDQLWLQTSEGHLNSSTKLQVLAMPVGVVAATYADAHPKGRGSVCPDAPFCTARGQSGCRR
jgi:hypothetical protein